MKKSLLLLLITLFTLPIFSQPEVSTRLVRALQNTEADEYIRVLVLLKDRVDIKALDEQLYRENASMERRAYEVITALQQKALETQGSLLSYLEDESRDSKVFQYESFWISNLVMVEAKPSVINFLMSRNDLAEMDIDAKLELDPYIVESLDAPRGTEAVEPGLRIINAHKLWELGITGQGRLVMGIDTGVHPNHPALNYKWRGNFVPANQAWLDPGGGTTSPNDCDGHGTHTVGTMVGLAPGTGDTIGVAHGAQWIAAKTICTSPHTSNSVAAFQWSMNPDGDPNTISDMPDAICNSWHDPNAASTQCTGIYKTTLDAVEAAGIAVVFSAGNNGPGASTITVPKNVNTNEVNVFATAAIDGAAYLGGNNNPIASFSSRGPSICGGTGSLLIKPEASAPGVSVRSSGSATGYTSLSGTSMAAPHIAGAVALLKQFAPNLTGKQILQALYNTAKDLGAAGEDNNYGMGLIDVYAAFLTLDAGELQPFNINTPSAGITVTSFPGSSTPVNITWDTSRATATYKWVFGSPTPANRLVEVFAQTNQLTLTLGQLDALLANAGLQPGDSVVGQWDVWAFRNNSPDFDSLKSANGPRAITLKRGIPALSPFSLVTPANNTSLTVSTQSSAQININWTRSGEGNTYKWKLGSNLFEGENGESKEAAILTLPSNNNGFDSSLTLVSSFVDAFLGGQGLLPGDSINTQWTVYAYNGLDSLKAAQTFNITLKRQAKGEVVVVYDSTAADGRVSRDTVLAYLNRNGITYDMFNKGTVTSTNSWSFRDYKRVIWLGQATSTISAVQRDSLKAYMNAGGPQGQKARLIIFSEDVGYQHGRSGSTNIDLNFVNQFLGWNYVADRPPSGANQGLRGDYINTNMMDSTIGTWPDVFSQFDPPTTHALYRYRSDNTIHGIGKVGVNHNAVTFGTDVRSIRRAIDSPPGASIDRMLSMAIVYVDNDGIIPVELTSFKAITGTNSVTLEWTTATETNNQGFFVERKTTETDYMTLGFVEGKGTTVQTQNYSYVDVGLSSGTYQYRLRQVDYDGTTSYSDVVEVEVEVPTEFSLSQNYPNPFNPSTMIVFTLPTDAVVTLKVFDVLGQEVATLLNKELAAGKHETLFDATKYNSGVYLYRIEAKGKDGREFNSVKKMLLLK